MSLHKSLKFVFLATLLFAATTFAQQTNPVDKQVANPITDQPNVNPIAPERDIKAPKTKQNSSGYKPEGGGDEIVVLSERETVSGEEGKRVIVHTGSSTSSRRDTPSKFVLNEK